jgi:diguanylate cyclase (GGDEF)-like protein
MTKLGNEGGAPHVYRLVYVASLALVVLSASALALLGREHVLDAAREVAVGDDQAVVRAFVTANLDPADLDGSLMLASRRALLEPLLFDLARQHGYEEVALVSPQRGEILAAASEGDSPAQVADGTIVAVAQGGVGAWIVVADTGASPAPASLVEAIPVIRGGEARMVFQIKRDAATILVRAGETLRDVVIVTASAAVMLAALLRAIFRAADSRLRKQHVELLEARRRDPLTGLLNHGAAVATLADRLEVARGDSSSLGIALVDIDNFRLLNDVHGSAAGDQALLMVAEAFRPGEEQWAVLARFGPDEFMAIAGPAVARDLPAAAQRVRERLESTHLELAGSERLPLTISVGIAYFPFHAGSVTDLISAATMALAESKAGGGNTVSIANAWTSEPQAPHSTFDVLQGLVLAIDRKDRYTKLHSEDVAAYALFLAGRIGMSTEAQTSLRIAALLHDVGKIGVPDDILRKPGRLTPREYEIVKQHVALGDLIVRDVPDIEQIREGIRYHHERWDGEGYMAGLAGANIPVFARILAVADAFSAMTTSRPYRKAIAAALALEELRAVAGTQLDRDLVDAFVTGIEQDPAAPLPGADRGPTVLWTPAPRAA